jgi:hypothetical protein
MLIFEYWLKRTGPVVLEGHRSAVTNEILAHWMK